MPAAGRPARFVEDFEQSETAGERAGSLFGREGLPHVMPATAVAVTLLGPA
jgi:hypothetical protein